MRAGGTGRRGWPLMSLGMVLGAWILMRVVLWENPFPIAVSPLSDGSSHSPLSAKLLPSAAADATREDVKWPVSPRSEPPEVLRAPVPQMLVRPDTAPPPTSEYRARSAVARGSLRGADRILAHTMMLAAAYSADGTLRRNDFTTGAGPIAPGVVHAPLASRDFAPVSSSRRWTVDMWALWRDDTTTPITSGRPSYGRSQIGAVLRYRLYPASDHAPQLHLRATRALEGASEGDLAGGVSARPIPALPIRVAAEARVSETVSGTRVRAAAYAVSELPPVELPGGFQAEAYVQGGYVTGEFATPFVDGQARVTRELAGTDDFRLTAGGAVWGGAQDDAQRLDIGPSAGVSFLIGQARGRIAADYRFRVAGDAEPSSGPALTLSAGF